MSLGLSLNKTLKTESGWFRGDLHAHTFHSDGALSPAELARTAVDEGLDFLAITDHNTIAAYPGFGPEPGVLMIPGIEVTLADGHFNVFGITNATPWLAGIDVYPDPLLLSGEWGSPSELMRQTLAEGLLNSINHPLLTPWAWLDDETDLRGLHCLEIWNDPSWPTNATGNPAAVALWTSWLNAGYRVTAIGGSDFHRPVPQAGLDKPAERLGLPSTYVYATELSGAAILDGMRRRRAYVSMGAQVAFEATHAGQTVGIGEDLGAIEGSIRFDAAITGATTPAVARLVRNGQSIAEQAVTETEETRFQVQTTVRPDEPAWYRLDVYANSGQMLAITNPIFAGPRREPAQHRFGDFDFERA
jgi:hypothetical protein